MSTGRVPRSRIWLGFVVRAFLGHSVWLVYPWNLFQQLLSLYFICFISRMQFSWIFLGLFTFFTIFNFFSILFDIFTDLRFLSDDGQFVFIDICQTSQDFNSFYRIQQKQWFHLYRRDRLFKRSWAISAHGPNFQHLNSFTFKKPLALNHWMSSPTKIN